MSVSCSTVLGQIANDFTDRQQRGESPTVEEYVAQHPDLADLLREVLPLLVAVGSPAATPSLSPLAGEPGIPDIPGFHILRELGRGGMGIVYEARQVGLNRLVALKMVLAGGESGTARFLAEAEMAARLRHPHIVQVYEMGQHQGRPYFAMEHVAGGTLAGSLAGQPQSARAAAELVRTLAEAVEHAHRAGVIHRDLKPANVLLEGAGGKVMIADFGLARHQDRDAGLTASGDIVGTPSYMAPEQARGESKKVGPAADIYALGAILYEMLTGRPPFKAATVYDTLVQVVSDDPVPPSRLTPGVAADLETIALECLHKEPAGRYASAQALADDLGRFLEGRPIEARPVGGPERAIKWARRRPALAALSSLLLVGGLIALTVVTLLWREAEAAGESARQNAERERDARQDAETAERDARETARREALAKTRALEAEGQAEHRTYLRNIPLADVQWRGGNYAFAESLLDQCPLPRRGWEWRHLWAQIRSRDQGVLDQTVASRKGVAASPDGTRLATTDAHRLYLHSGDGKVLCALDELQDPGRCVDFSPDGRLVAVAVDVTDATGLKEMFGQYKVKLWDARDGKPQGAVPGSRAVAFRPMGLGFAVGVGKEVRLHATAGLAPLATLEGHQAVVRSIHFSPRGDRLASADQAGEVLLWEVPGGGHAALAASLVGTVGRAGGGLRALAIPLAHNQIVPRLLRRWGDSGTDIERIAFDPAGTRLATCGVSHSIHVWDVESGRHLVECRGHMGRVFSVCWSARGDRLVSGSWDGSIRVWDPRFGREIATLSGHSGLVSGVAFTPQGHLVSSGSDGTLRRWDLEKTPGVRVLAGHQGSVVSLAVTPNGRQAASVGNDRTLRLWNLDQGSHRILGTQEDTGRRVAFDPTGRLLAASAGDGTIEVWDVDKHTKLHRLAAPPGILGAVAFSPRKRALLSGHPDGVRVWDLETGKLLSTWEMPSRGGDFANLLFHDDGSRVTAVSTTGETRTWDGASGAVLMTNPQRIGGGTLALAGSPDGRFLLIGGHSYDFSGRITRRDVGTGRELATFTGHSSFVSSLAYLPGGKGFASAGEDGSIRIWDLESSESVLHLPARGGAIPVVVFSPEGRRMLTGSLDGNVRVYEAPLPVQRFVRRQGEPYCSVAASPARSLAAVGDLMNNVMVWDAKTGKELLHLRSPETPWGLTFDPDGRHLVCGDSKGTVTAWRSDTGEEVRRWDAHKGHTQALAFGPGGMFATAGDDGLVRLWDFESAKLTKQFSGHGKRTRGITISPDGRLIASAGQDGSVQLWDVATGTQVERWTGVPEFSAVRFHPGGKLLAAGGSTGRLYLWDVATRKRIREVQAHPERIVSLGFREDGRRIVTCGLDRTVKLWDTETGDCVRTLEGHTHSVVGAQFVDDALVVSAGYDRTTRFWDLNSP